MLMDGIFQSLIYLKNNHIAQRARLGNVVLSNPPFESFTSAERLKYPEAVARSAFKPIAILDSVLDAAPMALGFVLPEPFIKGLQYKAQRQRIEKLYKDVELVSLPDRTFKHSVIRSSLVIARDLREAGSRISTVRSTVVTVQDRDQFLRGGEVSDTRAVSHSSYRGGGDLWINELEGVWESLAGNPRLESIASVHRGLDWHGEQSGAVRHAPHKGFALGIHAANAVKAFVLQEPEYLDCRPSNIRRAGNLPWADVKIVANAARLSRGPWCFAAAIDNEGFIFSQQLFGIWPKAPTQLHALCAILNSPIANAYIASHSPADRIRVGAALAIPLPPKISPELDDIAKRYARIASQGERLFSYRQTERADQLINQIDALVLKAYDLSPRLEKQLLEYFRKSKRPTSHDWSHWFPPGFTPYIPLHEYLSGEYGHARKNNLLRVFSPLPYNEAIALRETLE
jgi:hypothetical protein